MNSTSDQTAEPKFRVGQRVLTTFGHGTVERLTACSAAVHYDKSICSVIRHSLTWLAKNDAYSQDRERLRAEAAKPKFKVGDRVHTLTGEGTVTSTRRDPGTGAQHVDVCYVKGGVEHFKTYPAMDLWREIDEAKGRPVAAEAPKEEELVDAARRLGVEHYAVLERLDKAVNALHRAGFGRNELSGEWEPPANLAVEDVRMLRDTVEAQREYIYSLKAAVLELRASEQPVRTHSGGPWVHRTPPSSVCARLQAAWATVHLLLEQGEGADNG